MRHRKDKCSGENVEKVVASESKHQEMETEFVSVLEKYHDAGNITNYSYESNHNLMMQLSGLIDTSLFLNYQKSPFYNNTKDMFFIHFVNGN